jgi:competence/damage-inducible protein CinA-like protein
MPSAELIAIGTELLLGEIQDTNTRYLARNLRDIGLDVYRATLIGDNENRIAEGINDALSRADILITTGGLGPTVDDPTRLAVAIAFDTDLEFQPELWEEIQERFSRYGRIATANNRRQAYLPRGAKAISNPVGTAPAFLFQRDNKTIFCLPGVPKEMEHLLRTEVIPFLKQHYHLSGLIKARVLHTAGIGESHVDELIGELEKLENPTVGLLAHPGQTDIRITAKAESLELAEQMIEKLSQEIQLRLGDNIFGIDEDRLENVVHQQLVKLHCTLTIKHQGFDPNFLNRVTPQCFPAILIQPVSGQPQTTEHIQSKNDPSNISCTAILIKGTPISTLRMTLDTHTSTNTVDRSFGSAPEIASIWAENTILDFVRRKLIQIIKPEKIV